MDNAPFNLLLYSISTIILYTVFIPGVPKVVQYAFVPVIGLLSFQLVAHTTTGSHISDLGVGCMLLMQPLMHFANILFTDPDVDALVESESDESPSPQYKQGPPISKRSWRDRVVWTILLNVNIRAIGWKHQVRPILQYHPASTPRWTFVQRSLRCIARNTAVVLGALAANVCNPALTATSGPFSSAPMHWRVMGVLSCGLILRSGMDNMYRSAAICAVGGGFSTPDRWPDMFGPVFEAWSVSRFWRITWHQMLKRFLTVYATTFTKVLGLYPTPLAAVLSILESVIWLWTIFSLSGFVHIGGEYMVTRQLHLNGGIFKFFMLQPVAILLERVVFPGFMDASSIGASSCQPPPWIRAIGYCWVVLWFTWSFAPVLDVYLPTGLFNTNPLVDLMRFRFKDIMQEFVLDIRRAPSLVRPSR